MKILTLNPPYHPKFSRSQRSPAVIKSGVMYYPIWLAYATGVLEQDGFDVRLLDAPAEGMNLTAVLEFLDAFNPHLVVIDTSTPSIKNDLRTAKALKDKNPGLVILLTGPHVTALPEETLRMEKSVTAVIRGEYDFTVRDFARAIAGGNNDFSAIQGLTYRDSDNEIFHNPNRPWIEDLDNLPFVSEVYKKHLKVENYFYSITQYPEIAIITGRGCPYHCNYCLWPQTITGHAYRKRSIQNVVDEFKYIQEAFPQVKEIFIEDDTLMVDKKRSLELAKELIKQGNKLPFTANSRADVSYEILDELHKAGLRLVCVGFESGEQQILDNIHKNITIEKFYQFRDAARKADVLVHGCFMAGNTGETRESLQKTLDLAKKLNPDTAQFFPIMVYPGTEAYDLARKNNYLITDDYAEWLTEEGLHKAIINQSDLTAEEIVAWCDSARRSYYLRPKYILNKFWEILKHPREFRRIMKATKTFSKYLFRSTF